jgi:hypothetical protein
MHQDVQNSILTFTSGGKPQSSFRNRATEEPFRSPEPWRQAIGALGRQEILSATECFPWDCIVFRVDPCCVGNIGWKPCPVPPNPAPGNPVVPYPHSKLVPDLPRRLGSGRWLAPAPSFASGKPARSHNGIALLRDRPVYSSRSFRSHHGFNRDLNCLHEGLSSGEPALPERELSPPCPSPFSRRQGEIAKGDPSEFGFTASPRLSRAMDDAAAQVMSSPGYRDQDLRRPTGCAPPRRDRS